MNSNRTLILPLLVLSLGFNAAKASPSSPKLAITEFMAANNSGEKDEDGDFSDWIEIFNLEQNPVSVGGWYLSDDPQSLTKWKFPDVTIPGQGFVLVFASGKDRAMPTGTLHTNFKLDRDEEYLALVRPDGSTIASEFGPAFPRQISDVAYGISMNRETDPLVPPNANARILVATDERLGLTWLQPDFDDSTWVSSALGIGYDRLPPGTIDPSEPLAPLSDVTRPGDVIVPTSSNSPGNEGVGNAIDNDSRTKYLNFDKLDAGLTVTPASGPTVATGLRLTSANDAPDRDPTSYVLSGSNDGKTFVEIARGPIPIFSARFVAVEVAFANSAAFAQYRLLFPTVRNAAAAVAMQIAEVELLGYAGAPPLAFADLITTSVEPSLFGRSSSVYLRLPFTVEPVRPFENLALRIRYDDGFAAWLNGVLVARANAPQNPAYNAAALTNRFRRDAAREEQFDLRAHASLIRPGLNVLAVQGLNDRADSPDFLIEAQLENTRIIPGAKAYFEAPTPGRPNSEPSAGLVADPVVDRPRGFSDAPFNVAISCPTDGAVIHYTLDGTPPIGTNAMPYQGPIAVDRTTVLRAAAFRSGWHPSRIATHTYVFLNDVVAQSHAQTLAAGFPPNWKSRAADYGLDPRVVGPAGQDSFSGKYTRTLKADLQTIPTMSIVMSNDQMFGLQGIYANPESRGDAWERPASLELVYPDGRKGFQADAGIRIQGGAFRRFDLTLKKSFRMVFREKYGSAKLQYPLFGPEAADEFDNFVLRATSNDAWPYGGGSALYVRDPFAMETARAMGMIAPHTTFVHLYINGQYWGLYNPVERPDAAFSATYYGGDKDSWDAINQDSVPDGNNQAWNRLLAMLNQDLTKTEVYQRIQGNNPDGTRNPSYENLLDVDSMIDYMILNFYMGNADWPGRNWWIGRNRDNGDGFKFYPWDTETALGFTAVDYDRTSVNTAVARPYAALRVNADFRLRFADRAYRHFFHGGALYVNPASPAWDPAHPQNNRPAALFAALAEQASRAIVGESARWGDQLRTTPYTRDEHWQTARDRLFTTYFPRRSGIVLDQFRRAGLYPKTDAPEMSAHGGQVEPGFKLTLSAPQGTIYFTTNGGDPRVAVGALKYSEPITLNDLATIKARVLNGQEWSALNEATFVVGSPKLAITELHYHPAEPSEAESAAGFADENDFEFIELHNRGTATSDLTGISFVSGVQFEFTGSAITRLAPGEYVLVVKNRAAFEMRYGSGLPIAGEYSGKLDNAGERVELVNGRQETIVAFAYREIAPWPEASDGAGPSLEVIDPTGALDFPDNWRASQSIGGSPGRPSPSGPVILKVIGVEEGEFRFGFDGKAGLSYTIYVSDRFPASSWQVFERGEPPVQDTSIEVTIDISPSAPTRFFRVSIP